MSALQREISSLRIGAGVGSKSITFPFFPSVFLIRSVVQEDVGQKQTHQRFKTNQIQDVIPSIRTLLPQSHSR